MAYFKKEGFDRKRSRSDDRRSRGGPRESFKPFERDERPSRGRLELFDATCAKCGADCQLPFKPVGNRPVYCRDCFGKNDSYESNERPSYNSRSSPSGNSSGQLDEINRKLDRIMKHLRLD